MRPIYFIGCLCLAVHAGGNLLKGQDAPPLKTPFSFTRLTAHWDEYSSDEYLKFLDEVKPEVAQVGFWVPTSGVSPLPRTERVIPRTSR